MSAKKRFYKYIERITESGCWIWTGFVSPDGYGRFRMEESSRLAHRCSYVLHRGPIPDGLEINHICGIRSCVNPDHLEAVTHQENVDKSIRIKKTHCHNGHPLSGDNLYEYRGLLACKICRRAANRRRSKKLTDEKKANNLRISKMCMG